MKKIVDFIIIAVMILGVATWVSGEQADSGDPTLGYQDYSLEEYNWIELNDGIDEVFTIEANGGDMVFNIRSKEVIRIKPSGAFYVNEELTIEDKELYVMMKQWLTYVLGTFEEIE